MEMQKVWLMFDNLPANAKQEVADFIEFLLSRYQRSGNRKPSQKSKISDDPFIGMWIDRQDLQDSEEWLRGIRLREWNSRNA